MKLKLDPPTNPHLLLSTIVRSSQSRVSDRNQIPSHPILPHSGVTLRTPRSLAQFCTKETMQATLRRWADTLSVGQNSNPLSFCPFAPGSVLERTHTFLCRWEGGFEWKRLGLQ